MWVRNKIYDVLQPVRVQFVPKVSIDDLDFTLHSVSVVCSKDVCYNELILINLRVDVLLPFGWCHIRVDFILWT